MTERVPANLIAYVDALGADVAIGFLLKFGGSEIYLAANPGAHCELAPDETPAHRARLAEKIGPGNIKVPLARRWLAAELRRRNFSNAEIARRVRADVATVRKWFAEADARSSQLSLL